MTSQVEDMHGVHANGAYLWHAMKVKNPSTDKPLWISTGQGIPGIITHADLTTVIEFWVNQSGDDLDSIRTSWNEQVYIPRLIASDLTKLILAAIANSGTHAVH